MVVITPALTTGPGGVEVAPDVVVEGRDGADFVAKYAPDDGHFLRSVFVQEGFQMFPRFGFGV